MSLPIGKVASYSGISVDAIRFYERNGLIPEPARRESGYRDYPQETVFRLKFIRNAKELGFTLAEIRELLGLQILEESGCESVQKLAAKKILVVKEKIQSLVRIQCALEDLLESCKEPGISVSGCPFLDALEKQDR
jgi:Hg(II)-responsive transcriptional regulator